MGVPEQLPVCDKHLEQALVAELALDVSLDTPQAVPTLSNHSHVHGNTRAPAGADSSLQHQLPSELFLQQHWPHQHKQLA